MNNQPSLFDAPTGRQLAEQGIRQSVEHADAVEPTWSERAFKILWTYALTHVTFTVEEVKDHAYANGLPRPPAEGAWGSPTRRAIKQGIIRFDSYRESKNASRHNCPVKVWRSQNYGA